MTDEQVEYALARLRVELFTALQTLKGKQLSKFKALIRDIAATAEIIPPGGVDDIVPHNAEVSE